MTIQQIQKLIDQTNPQNHQSKVTEVFNSRDGKSSAITWNFLDDVELDSVGLTEEYIDELYFQINHDGKNTVTKISVRMSVDKDTYDREKVFEARKAIYDYFRKELLVNHGTDFEKPSREVFTNTMEIGHLLLSNINPTITQSSSTNIQDKSITNNNSTSIQNNQIPSTSIEEDTIKDKIFADFHYSQYIESIIDILNKVADKMRNGGFKFP